MSTPTFVVGTGRCGSTMLSNMLREHPSILSISEFFSFAGIFSTPISQLFPPDLIEAKAFWKIVAGAKPRSNLLLKYDLPLPEMLYPAQSPQSSFSFETGVPAILNTTLPHLTDRYHQLFDEIHEYVINLPAATIDQHYKNLFSWLQKRFNKKLWIERSGGILKIMEHIVAIFPDARFIHIVRDGRNVALSLSNHLGLRLFLLSQILTEHLGVNPYESEDRTNVDRVPLELQRFLPENFDRQAFLDYKFPLSLWGQFWSQQIINGLDILNQVPQDRLLTIVYEDLLEHPQISLHKLMAFLGQEFIDPAWIETVSATVRQPRSSWQNLPDRDRSELIKACQPGFEALNNAGIRINGNS